MAWEAALKTLEVQGEERTAHRHSLSLSASASGSGQVTQVRIHNLSMTGLLLESALDLTLGDEIEVELPEARGRRACVVWHSDGFYGCEFEELLSDAALAAARLRSMPLPPVPESPARFDASADQDSDLEPRYTLRRKAGIIVGLAAASWALVIAAILLIV